jgi:hypothetical protein
MEPEISHMSHRGNHLVKYSPCLCATSHHINLPRGLVLYQFNINLSSVLRSSKWSLLMRFRTIVLYEFRGRYILAMPFFIV